MPESSARLPDSQMAAGRGSRVRRLGKLCTTICRRTSNRLKSPDCLLCIFTCTFVYVLCFIFILAIVVRSSSVSRAGARTPLAQAADLVSSDERSFSTLDGVGGDSAGSVRGRGGRGRAEDVLYDRRSVEDVLVEESAFNDTALGEPPDAGDPGQPDPEVLTDTSHLVGIGSQDFKFALQVDMPDLLQRVRAGKPAPVRPINRLEAPWLIGHAGGCSGSEFLLLLVKSHPSNYAKREAIRSTWGRVACWRHQVKIFFLMGADAAYGVRHGRRIQRRVRDWRKALAREDASRGDLLVREFVDHYYNNTLKLMSGVQWSVGQCPRARFTAFLDDDFFVNPYQVERQLDSLSPAVYGRFLGGWVWRTSLPRRRTRRRRSKWDISLTEYPWPSYPPYVAAGAMFISGPVLSDLSVAMQYTKYLRFDDIFIGLVAHKLLLSPLHMEFVRAYEPVAANSTDTKVLMRLVASHGFSRPGDMRLLWQRLHLSGLCTSAEPEG